MKFHVTEIKALGSSMGRRLSLRLEKSDDPNSAQQSNGMGDPPPAVFTIHAVVPYSPEFGPTQIGQEFELVKSDSQVKPVTISSAYCQDDACSLRGPTHHIFGKGCRLYKSKP